MGEIFRSNLAAQDLCLPKQISIYATGSQRPLFTTCTVTIPSILFLITRPYGRSIAAGSVGTALLITNFSNINMICKYNIYYIIININNVNII